MSVFTAEVIGTFLLVFIGNNSVAQKIAQEGNVLDINLAYGLGCAFGVYVSGGISGGHLNPAVSISQLILGNITLKLCLVYIAAQMLGAFLTRACQSLFGRKKLSDNVSYTSSLR